MGACVCCLHRSHALASQSRRFAEFEAHMKLDVVSSAQREALIQSLRQTAVLVGALPTQPRFGPHRLSLPLQCVVIQFLTPGEHFLCRQVSRAMYRAAKSPQSWPVRLLLARPPPGTNDEDGGDSSPRRGHFVEPQSVDKDGVAVMPPTSYAD
jgi:hypothetical protein